MELSLFQRLKNFSAQGTIRIGIVGCGSMGSAMAHTLSRLPGMSVVALCDVNRNSLNKAFSLVISNAKEVPECFTNALHMLDKMAHGIDVLVEATNSVNGASETCIKALSEGMHLVLMNAEVDLLLGSYLQSIAHENGVKVTSDAGDQHGVLARLIDEVQLWGLSVVMAGNLKGYLNRHSTLDSIRLEARKRSLSLEQCLAYTDGTKLNIEMALVANGFNMRPTCRGMTGPIASNVQEAFQHFSFDSHSAPFVDYLLGANPGGGVFVIAHSKDPIDRRYMEYYKKGKGPFYLFYRPFHLCHFETALAIARLYFDGEAVLSPPRRKICDVVAVTKSTLAGGVKFCRAIGSDLFYGVIEDQNEIESEGLVPIGLLDSPQAAIVLKHKIEKDTAITYSDLDLPLTQLGSYFEKQEAMIQGYEHDFPDSAGNFSRLFSRQGKRSTSETTLEPN